MTVLVALTPGERGSAAFQAGTVLARSAGDRVVVAAVVPTPWPPSPFPGETEYLAYAERTAEQALARARGQLGSELTAEFTVHHARSVAAGLLELTAEHRATVVVLGSSSDGLLGRVGLGAVAHRVLHSTEIPVLLAPRGYLASGTRIIRVTAAFGPRDARSDLVRVSSTLADGLGASLRVASFAVRSPTGLTGGLDHEGEDLVAHRWAQEIETMVSEALGDPPAATVSTAIETVVGQGDTWAEAIGDVGWTAGDLLVVGTSTSAISRFLLGSHASKVTRNSPVPVYLVPRSIRD